MRIGLFQPAIGDQHKPEDAALPPNVLFKDGDGRIIDLTSLRGKIIFINFWATWCPPCIAEMPSINVLYKTFKNHDNVVFLMVDVDGNYEKADNFMKKHQLDLKVVIPASQIPSILMDETVPTTLIIDKKGKIVYRHKGVADYSNPRLVDMIDQLDK
ncbi:TlpA disulfide reductase family protein [Dyadobacter sp. CY312]|uniref:TlpA family protein disulfide reductase n=1 Tax=Dyadobacter sp. CY312 TaxID=2907303 RepID=UPI001F456090|nr:TlpA disulfide reductase family protein [Dyadobacter sp. CY312]MCE7042707.1 TlpA family protein disulfide reductase [Dyadobacter sp. CY312]